MVGETLIRDPTDIRRIIEARRRDIIQRWRACNWTLKEVRLRGLRVDFVFEDGETAWAGLDTKDVRVVLMTGIGFTHPKGVPETPPLFWYWREGITRGSFFEVKAVYQPLCVMAVLKRLPKEVLRPPDLLELEYEDYRELYSVLGEYTVYAQGICPYTLDDLETVVREKLNQ